MNILFLSPRFHTNQYEIIKCHISNNDKVFMHTKTTGSIENHDVLKPLIYPESIITKFIITKCIITKYIITKFITTKSYFEIFNIFFIFRM